MDTVIPTIRTTIIIKFAIQPQDIHVNAGKACAVCGSQLHMTKHCPVHP